MRMRARRADPPGAAPRKRLSRSRHGVEFRSVTPSVAIGIALSIALLAAWVVVLREGWRAWQPARLLLLGRYADARSAAERLERSWMRIFPTVRQSARYAVGAALHLEGQLERSIEALAPLHRERIRGNMRYAVCSIDAASLVLLDRDPARARELLDEAARDHRAPEDLLLGALVQQSLGDQEAAGRLFARAGATRGTGGVPIGRVLVVEDRRQQEAIFHALRGLFLVKSGRTAEAQRDLDIAAESAVGSIYVTRARALRSRRDLAEGPRSSLAPLTMGPSGEGEEGSPRL